MESQRRLSKYIIDLNWPLVSLLAMAIVLAAVMMFAKKDGQSFVESQPVTTPSARPMAPDSTQP